MTFENLASLLLREASMDDGAIAEDFFDRKERGFAKIVNEFRNGAPRLHWNVIRAIDAIKVWNIFGKYRRLDEGKLFTFKEIVLDNIALLDCTTDLSGHADFLDPQEVMDEFLGIDPDEDSGARIEVYGDRFLEFLEWENGEYMLSDFGLRPLKMDCYPSLFRAEGENVLYALDRVFNVIHARGDLSQYFIEGGKTTLNKLRDL